MIYGSTYCSTYSWYLRRYLPSGHDCPKVGRNRVELVEPDDAVEHSERHVLHRLALSRSAYLQPVERFCHVAMGLDGNHPGRLVNVVADVLSVMACRRVRHRTLTVRRSLDCASAR